MMFRSRFVSSCLLSLSLISVVSADDKPPRQVTSYTGPELWQVSNGDNKLYIFGWFSPFPESMSWDDSLLSSKLESADSLIYPPNISLKANHFKGLMALPKLKSIKTHPEAGTLKEQLSPELYTRWQQISQAYKLDSKVEQYRPLFAAIELLKVAKADNGLSAINPLWGLLKLHKKQDGVTTVSAGLVHKVEEPRRAIDDFRYAPLAETECFEVTLDKIEHGFDLEQQKARAWGQGDLTQLKRLNAKKYKPLCDGILNKYISQQLVGLENTQAYFVERWMDKVKTALETSNHTVAVLPINTLLNESPYLEALRNQGYHVESPQ